jgi:hypothetical protein
MVAAYNNDGHAARYICNSQDVSYGRPFCQSLKAAPVDEQVTSIVLHALEPAASGSVLLLPPLCKPSAPPWSNSGVSVWNAGNIKSTRPVAVMPAPSRRTTWWRGRWSETGRKLRPGKRGLPLTNRRLATRPAKLISVVSCATTMCRRALAASVLLARVASISRQLADDADKKDGRRLASARRTKFADHQRAARRSSRAARCPPRRALRRRNNSVLQPVSP